MALGDFSERVHHPVSMDLGHFSLGTSRSDDIMGYLGGRRIKPGSRLVRLRLVVGLHSDDKRHAGFVATVFTRMAYLRIALASAACLGSSGPRLRRE